MKIIRINDDPYFVTNNFKDFQDFNKYCKLVNEDFNWMDSDCRIEEIYYFKNQVGDKTGINNWRYCVFLYSPEDHPEEVDEVKLVEEFIKIQGSVA